MLRISMEGHNNVTLCYRNANVLTLILRNFHKSTVYNLNIAHVHIENINFKNFSLAYIKFISICSRLQIIQAKWKRDKEGHYITLFLHKDTTLFLNMFTCIKK